MVSKSDNSLADKLCGDGVVIGQPGTSTSGPQANGYDITAPPDSSKAVPPGFDKPTPAKEQKPTVAKRIITTLHPDSKPDAVKSEIIASVTTRSAKDLLKMAIHAGNKRRQRYVDDDNYTAEDSMKETTAPDFVAPIYTIVGKRVNTTTTFPMDLFFQRILGRVSHDEFLDAVLNWKIVPKDDPTVFEKLQQWMMAADDDDLKKTWGNYAKTDHSKQYCDIVCAHSRPFVPANLPKWDKDGLEVNQVFKLLFDRTKSETAVAIKACEIYHALLSTPRGEADLYGGQEYAHGIVDAISLLAEVAVYPAVDFSTKLRELTDKWAQGGTVLDDRMTNYTKTIQGLIIDIVYAVPQCFFVDPTILDYATATIKWSALQGYTDLITKPQHELICYAAQMLYYGINGVKDDVPAGAQAVDLLDLSRTVWNDLLRPATADMLISADRAATKYSNLSIHRPGKSSPDPENTTWWHNPARQSTTEVLNTPLVLGQKTYSGCDYSPVMLFYRSAAQLWAKWMKNRGGTQLVRAVKHFAACEKHCQEIVATLGDSAGSPQWETQNDDGAAIGGLGTISFNSKPQPYTKEVLGVKDTLALCDKLADDIIATQKAP